MAQASGCYAISAQGVFVCQKRAEYRGAAQRNFVLSKIRCGLVLIWIGDVAQSRRGIAGWVVFSSMLSGVFLYMIEAFFFAWTSR